MSIREVDTAAMRILALYIRVSTEDQAIEGNSLTEQEELLRSFAQTNGWHEVRLYCDDGYSGKSLQRPAITRLIEDVKAGKVMGVITTRIDRLSRRTKDFGALLETFNDHKCFYKSVRQNFEINTASGKMTAQIFSVFAEFERDMIAERVYENLHSMAKRGSLPTKPTFGYMLENGNLVPHPEESKWVRKAAELLLSGQGSRQVAKYLNENGVQSKTGRLWSDTAVRALFHNEVLTGRVVWNKRKYIGKKRVMRDPSEWIVLEDNHEPLLTVEEFDTINSLIERRQSMAPRARGGARLLSGIAVCGYCGERMAAGWQIYPLKDGRHRHKTYRCGKYVKGGGCRINRVDAEELDGAVIGFLTKQLDETDLTGISITAVSGFDDEIAECKRKIKQFDERVQRLFDTLSLGYMSPQDFASQRDKLNEQKVVEESRLAQIETLANASGTEEVVHEQFRLKLESLRDNLAGDEDAQRSAVLQLVHQVRVFREDWRSEPEIEIDFKI